MPKWTILLTIIGYCLSSCQMKQSSFSVARVSDRLYTDIGNEVETGLKLRGFRNAELAEERSGLFIEGKFDPTKTTVLLIHGLVSEPETWQPLVSHLKSDPTIANNFQFIYYAYPTGTPTVGSGAILKRHLDAMVAEVESTYSISMDRNIIVIGHSMGGILAKSLISDSGDTLYNKAFTAPLNEFDLEAEQKQFLGEAFRYQPRKYVKKVVFLATPHRGSGRAQGIVGRIGTALSARPMLIENLAARLLEKNSDRLQPDFADFITKKVNSVATLRPDSPITVTLADLPIDPEVEFHSIAGIKNARKFAGDGVVSLESTFVEGAHCEVGIYSDHGVHQNPITYGLVQTILERDYNAVSDDVVVEILRKRDLAFIRYRGINYE